MKFCKTFLLCALVFLISSTVMAADSGDKFPLKDVSVEYNKDIGMSMVEGEITNNSGKSYETAIFKISFYDASSKLLGSADVAIMEGFEKGDTVTFDGVSEKDVSGWKTYKVRLEMSA